MLKPSTAIKPSLIRVVIVVAWVISVACSFNFGVFFGSYSKGVSINKQDFTQKKQILEPFLKSYPEFAKIELLQYSDYTTYIVGTVENENDYKTLETFLRTELGRAKAEYLMREITVRVRNKSN